MNVIAFLSNFLAPVALYLLMVLLLTMWLRNRVLNYCKKIYPNFLVNRKNSASLQERLNRYIRYKKEESFLVGVLAVLLHIGFFFLLAILDLLWERKVFPFVFLMSSLGCMAILGLGFFWLKRMLWVFFQTKEAVFLIIFGSQSKIEYFLETQKLP